MKKDRDAALADLDALGQEPEPLLPPSITSLEPTLESVAKNLGLLCASLGIFADECGSFVGGHGMSAENRLCIMTAKRMISGLVLK